MPSIPKLLKAGTWLVSSLPRSLCYVAAKAWAWFQFHADKKRRAVMLKNLSFILPESRPGERKLLAMRAFRIFAMNAVDFLVSPTLSAEEILAMVEASGDEPLDGLRGNGFIVLTAHLGNWDFAGQWLWARGVRGKAIAEMVEQDEWFEAFRAYRGREGFEIVPLNVNPVSLARCLIQGGTVVLVGDRDLTGTGFEAGFFSGLRRFPRGPGALAVRLGVPVLPGCVVRRNTRITEKRPYLAIGFPLIYPEGRSEEEMDAEIVRVLADMVRRFPEQWFVFQDEWL
ncbi:MAG: lysophospholipid acyltransferase family protein [candidate division WOR-3 bacterium]